MRAASGALLISRARLEQRMAAAPVVLLEAPGGYGKSTASQALGRVLDAAMIRVVLRTEHDAGALVEALAVGARRAGLPLVAAVLDAETPDASLDRLIDRMTAVDQALIAVDEVHRATPNAQAWLATLARELPDGQRLVAAGRRLHPQLRRLPMETDAILLGADDLRFATDEIAAVVVAVRGTPPDEAELLQIAAATDGWPAAVVLAARAGMGAVSESRNSVDVLRDLIDRLLEPADQSLRALVPLVAQLPLLSIEAVEAIGGRGALDRLLDAGLPIRFRPDGWGELPNPIRELVAGAGTHARIGIDAARRVALHYAERGELAEGASLLHRLSDHEGIADLLARQPRGLLGRSGLALYDPIVADIPDTVLAACPDALVQLVRSADKLPRLHRRWLERGTQVLPTASAAGRAMTAEWALEVARAGDLEGGLRRAGDVIAAADPQEVTTIGRAHFCRALCMMIQDTAGSTSDVRHELEMAISRFHLAGERDWEAEALQDLGYGVWFTTGALDAAADALEKALALRPASDAARAETLTALAEVVTYIGRLDDAAVALREARAIAQRLGDERTLGYVAWSSAELGATRRDREAAIAALEEAERHPGVWFGGLAGIDFLSHASEIRAVIGDVDGAWRDLARAEVQATGTPREGEPLSARVRLEAMYGDPVEGLRLLDELERSPFVYPNDRWLHPLLRAACLARLGEHAQARVQLRLSRQICTEQGDPDRPERREPEVLAIAEPGTHAPAEPPTMIITMGRFAVERSGQDVSPPPGRPQTLVKMLALRTQMTIDEAIDELWPEADVDTGRARLRNLLNRVKASSGELVVRTDGAVGLAPWVDVDAVRFEQEAAAALSAPAETRAGLARAALARSTGELLPAERYADWATVPRERLRRRHLGLLDIVSDDAIARGDFDEADRLLDEAITVDPLDEIRYVRLARALATQGRMRRAKRVVDQAVAVAEELGVEPTDELSELLRDLAVAQT